MQCVSAQKSEYGVCVLATLLLTLKQIDFFLKWESWTVHWVVWQINLLWFGLIGLFGLNETWNDGEKHDAAENDAALPFVLCLSPIASAALQRLGFSKHQGLSLGLLEPAAVAT